MSDVNAAATLSLAISTGDAAKQLQELKTAYAALKGEFATGLQATGISKEAADQIQKLGQQVQTLQSNLKSMATEHQAQIAVLNSNYEKFEKARVAGQQKMADAARASTAAQSAYAANATKLLQERAAAAEVAAAAERRLAEATRANASAAQSANAAITNKLLQERAAAAEVAAAAERRLAEATRANASAAQSAYAANATKLLQERAAAAEVAAAAERRLAEATRANTSAAQAASQANTARLIAERAAAASGTATRTYNPLTNTYTTTLAQVTTAGALSQNMSQVATATSRATVEQHNWNKAAKDGRAFARGLSGSLGALWMTYGNLAPLMAGAALAGGFKAAATAGSEFAYQLTFVKALGGETAQAVAQIGASALELSKTSMYGPGELANGLRMLSQAGLSARDSLLALPVAMNLATVGEMNMQQATLTLVGVMNAFGMGITDLTHIGDMFSKAAALSQTSVSAMTEAMKTASVVHEQYGASIEDTATAMTLLAKVNIIGTAAGTSYRNMLKDLYTPTKEAARVMEDLGIKTKDTVTGKLRDAPAIIADLKTKLQGFTQASQTDILGKIFSERGGKEAIQMLAAVGEEWDTLKAKISNSEGFMAGVTAELEMTTKGRFKQALNTMQANMISAFDASEGSVRKLADALRNLADSPEFIAGIKAIVGVIASLANALVKVTPLLIDFGLAWGAFKILGTVVTGVSAVISALGGLGTSAAIVSAEMAIAGKGTAGLIAGLTATGSAAGAAAGATGLGGLGAAIEFLTHPVTLAVAGLGALAYAAYKLKEDTPAGIVQVNNFNAVLDRQIAKLKEANAELERKNRLQNTGSDIDRDAAQANLDTLRKERKALEERVAARTAKARSSGNLQDIDRAENANTLDAQRIRQNKDAEIAQIQKMAELEKQQANHDELNLKSYLAQARQGLKDLKDDAFHAKKNVKTTLIEAAIGQMEAGGLDQAGLRAVQRNLDRYMQEGRQSLLGSGTQTYTTPESGASARAAAGADGNSEALALINKKFDGHIQAIRTGTTLQLQAIQESYKALQIGELEMIQQTTDANVKEHTAARSKMEEQLAAAIKGGAKGSELEALRGKIAEETAAITAAYNKGAIDTAGAKTKLEEVLTKWDTKTSSAATPTAMDDAAAQVAEFSKEINALTTHFPEEKLEQIRQVIYRLLAEGGRKDLIARIQTNFNEISTGLTDLNSDVDKMESDMERDGGWVARVFQTGQITDLIQNQLPALRAQLEETKALMDSAPDADEKGKYAKQYATQKAQFDKLAHYVPKVWRDVTEEVDSTFHDGFTAMLSKGETDWSAFTQTLKDRFRTTVVESIYQMFARPLVMNVMANVVGSFSGSSSASTGVSGSGNLLSTGKGLWDAYSGAGNLYNGFALSGAGQSLGLSAMGAGLSTAVGGGVVSTTSLSGIAAASQGVTTTSGLTSLGSAIGTAVPYIGLAVAAASLLGGLFGDKGGPKTEGDFIGHIKADGSIEQESTRYSKRAASDALAAAAPSLAKTISQTIASLGGDATGLGLRYWSSVDPEGTAGDMGKSRVFDADGNLVYKNSWTVDRGEYAQELALEFQRMTLAAIKATDVPTIFKEVVDGVNLAKASAEELAGALKDVQGIAQLRKAFDLVDLGAENLSLTLIDFSGGIETLAGNLSSYYEAYFSESERLTNTAQQVAESFADMGQAIPQNTAGFRSLVESLDLTTDSGKETFASLMSVQSAFASVMAAIDGLKDGVANATLALRSEQEQAVIQQQKLADAAKAAGVAIPQSVDELLRLADGIDYTTAAGLQLAAAMPELASAFSTAKTAAETAKTAAETAIKALASTASDTYDIAVEYADAAVDAAQTALDAARDVAERSINAAYESASSALESQINNLQSISSTIANALASNGVENSLAGYRMAQQGLELALAQMRSGITPDANSVSSMVGKATGLNSDWFASQSDMLRAQARTNATLSELGKVTGSQQTAAEAQLTALKAQYEEQINALNGIDGTVKSVEEALADYAKAQKALKTAEFQREQVEIGKAQLDELNGVNNGIESLADAMQSLNDSIYALALATMQAVTKPVGNYTSTNGATYSAETDTWTTKAGEGTTESLRGILQNIFQTSGASATYHAATNAGLSIRDVDRIANLTAGTTYQAAAKEIKESVVSAAASGGSMAAYDKAKALGLTMDQLDALMTDGDPNWYPGLTEEWAKANKLPTFASGGYHSGGLRLVGERGPELEVTGPSQILNSDITRRLMGGNNEELLEELKAVKAELAAMRAANEATARNTFSTKQSLDRVVDGDAILTRAAA